MERGLVGLSALIFAGIGAWTLVDPLTPLRTVGVVVSDARGVVELSAMYGGLELGMAVFLVWCLRAPARVWSGLMAATLTIGALGGARLGNLLVHRPDEAGLLWGLCAVELTGAALGAVLLWRAGARVNSLA